VLQKLFRHIRMVQLRRIGHRDLRRPHFATAEQARKVKDE
jgi:hypothetical protein